MFIRITKSPDKKKAKVYLVEGFRNKEGKIKQRIIKRYGDLDDLLAHDPQALEKLKIQAKEMTQNNKNQLLQINLNRNESINEASSTINYGYFFLEKIYKELKIKSFLQQAKHQHKFRYDLDSILKMLVYGRVLNPKSKLETFNNQTKYFEPFNNKLQDVYRSLTELNNIKDDMQVYLHQQIKKNFGRDESLVLYDLTNYYFEIEKEDGLKKVGVSKEQKTSPIIQMGLLIDQNKIPIGYELFPGNTHDSKTAIPMIQKLKDKFQVKRLILTADKGINTSINFAFLASQGDGYIVSQKVRGAKKEFINEVLNNDGYIYWGDDFKYKEVFQKRGVKVNNEIITLHEKVVIFWSKNFDHREKYKHEKLNKKINEFLNCPARLKASNTHGIKRYIKTSHLNNKTGEVKKINYLNTFDEAKYNRDVNLDGYYAIVTSELDKPVDEILESYHELWKIEESFKVIKSDLKGRPVFVQRNDRIEGHFLTCFIALTMLRLLEHKLKYKYSSLQIRKGLKTATCKEFGKGVYSMEPQSDAIMDLEKLHNSYIHHSVSTHEVLRRYKKAILHNKK